MTSHVEEYKSYPTNASINPLLQTKLIHALGTSVATSNAFLQIYIKLAVWKI